jgi:hypothetical protein
MKKVVLLCWVLMACSQLQAQDKLKQQLFYYNPKGLSFIPPLSKPGIMYDGKLYVGKKQLEQLFKTLNDAQLNTYFFKYKKNKSAANILSVAGYILPIVNIAVSANDGKFNWWLFGGGLLTGGVGGYFNGQAQKNLLQGVLYYDNKQKAAVTGFVPRQQTIGIAIPLSK